MKSKDHQPSSSCIICNITYAKLKRNMCHNCYKIFDAARQVARQKGGNIQMLNAKFMQVTCSASHTWSVPFSQKIAESVKSVKIWCAMCNRSERDVRKAFHRDQEASREQELFEMQAKLISQARGGSSRGAARAIAVMKELLLLRGTRSMKEAIIGAMNMKKKKIIIIIIGIEMNR